MADANAPKSSRRSSVGMTVETTSGTYATTSAPLTSTDCFDAEVSPFMWYGNNEREPIGPTGGHYREPRGLLCANFSFRIKLVHGCALLANQIIMRAFCYANNTGYKPVTAFDSNRKTFSTVIQDDGTTHRLKGCVANGVFSFEAGKSAELQVTGQGVYSTTADETLFASSIPTTLPYHRLSVLTLDGAEIGATQKVTIDLGNVIDMRYDLTADEGAHYFYVARRRPIITVDPEARTVAQIDHWGLMASADEAPLIATLSNGSNTMAFTAGAAQRIDLQRGDRNGIRINTLQFKANVTSADDEISVVAA